MSENSDLQAFHVLSPTPPLDSSTEAEAGLCETSSRLVFLKGPSPQKRKPDSQIYTTNLIVMDLSNPEDEINKAIPDIADVTIEPFFDIDIDSAEESTHYELKNNLIITMEPTQRVLESYHEIEVEILTSVRNIECHQKCCVYEYKKKMGVENKRYEVCVGHSYEILEYFKSDGAILECEVCLRLPLPDNCVKI